MLIIAWPWRQHGCGAAAGLRSQLRTLGTRGDVCAHPCATLRRHGGWRLPALWELTPGGHKKPFTTPPWHILCLQKSYHTYPSTTSPPRDSIRVEQKCNMRRTFSWGDPLAALAAAKLETPKSRRAASHHQGPPERGPEGLAQNAPAPF